MRRPCLGQTLGKSDFTKWLRRSADATLLDYGVQNSTTDDQGTNICT
jgi:hypothetical protein